SGYTLEAAELAEWMDFLFEDRHAEREAQARRVREMDISNVAVALPEMLGDVSAEDVRLLPDSTSALEAIAAAEREADEEAQPPPLPERRDPSRRVPNVSTSEESAPPRSKRGRWPLVVLLL